MCRGEVLDDGQALYGMVVNLAARIAALAQPGSTLLSATCRDELNGELDGPFEDMGPCWLKHVEEPLRLFRLPARRLALPETIEQAISERMRLKPTLLLLPTDSPGEGPARASTGLEQVVTDRLTRAFCRSPMLHVISPMSARTLRGRHLEQAELYRRFRADYLLQTALVTPSSAADADSQRVRLRASLWRRGAAEPVWSDESSGTALDALSADSSLLGRLVEGVGKRILNVEQRVAQHSQVLPNLASHTLYLNAVDQLHRFSTAAFENSQRLLLALHERAPRHAEPLAWLARWHVFKVVQGWSADSQRDGMMALDYSQRALDCDPNSALALTMAGSVHAGVKRDAASAQRLYAQALTHDPNDSLAWLMSGVAQGFLNEGPPALAASETALGLAPVDPTRHYYDSLSATTALRAGEYERCVILAQRAIQANSTHGSAYRSQAIAEWLLGRQADSIHTIQRLLGVEPHFTVRLFLARVPEQDPRREEFAQILSAAGLPAE
jgi:tetratricopeptide (TPR) repeat protein